MLPVPLGGQPREPGLVDEHPTAVEARKEVPVDDDGHPGGYPVEDDVLGGLVAVGAEQQRESGRALRGEHREVGAGPRPGPRCRPPPRPRARSGPGRARPRSARRGGRRRRRRAAGVRRRRRCPERSADRRTSAPTASRTECSSPERMVEAITAEKVTTDMPTTRASAAAKPSAGSRTARAAPSTATGRAARPPLPLQQPEREGVGAQHPDADRCGQQRRGGHDQRVDADGEAGLDDAATLHCQQGQGRQPDDSDLEHPPDLAPGPHLQVLAWLPHAARAGEQPAQEQGRGVR